MREKYRGFLAVASTQVNFAEQMVLAYGLRDLFNPTKPNLIITGTTKDLVDLAERYSRTTPHVAEIKMSNQLNPQAMEPFSLPDAIASLTPLLGQEYEYRGVLILAHPALASSLLGSLHALTDRNYPSMSDNLAMGISTMANRYLITPNGIEDDLRR